MWEPPSESDGGSQWVPVMLNTRSNMIPRHAALALNTWPPALKTEFLIQTHCHRKLTTNATLKINKRHNQALTHSRQRQRCKGGWAAHAPEMWRLSKCGILTRPRAEAAWTLYLHMDRQKQSCELGQWAGGPGGGPWHLRCGQAHGGGLADLITWLNVCFWQRIECNVTPLRLTKQ